MRWPPRRELGWTLGIFLASLGVRLGLVLHFPTQPTSDFAGLVDLAVTFRDQGLASPASGWHLFNPGVSTSLALILRLGFSADPVVVSRLATVIVTALVPLLPLLMWRDVLGWRARLFAALLLALWPAHVLFAGVVAQDNWVLLPSVALASLAVRTLKRGDAHPILAAILWTWAGYTRQEMWLALSPLLVAAAVRRRRDLVPLGLVIAVLFGLIANQRYRATGRVAVSTEHFGEAFLGTMVPDVGGEWRNPEVFLTAQDNDVGVSADQRKVHLALAELARRPGHHLLRIFGSSMRSWNLPDRLLFFSLTADDVLPASQKAEAAHFATAVSPLVDLTTIVCNGAFVAALLVAMAQWRRRREVLVIGAAALLKMAVHTALVTQSRFFLAVWALELLAIVVAVDGLEPTQRRRALALFLGCTAVVGVLAWLGSEAAGVVLRQDEADHQLTYRIPLDPLRCKIDRGRLSQFDANQLVLKLDHNNPTHGDLARAECQPVARLPSLSVVVEAAAETRPQRIERRLFVDDQLIWHQLSGFEPLSSRIDLPSLAPESRLRLEVEMLNDDPTWTWSPAGVTALRVVR